MNGATRDADALPPGALRVAAALEAAGAPARIVRTPASAHTAEQAAAACGCDVGQIVKSLVFRDGPDGPARMVLASGANRVHEKRLGRLLGVALTRADADFVKAATGFSIGGVSPFGLPEATRAGMILDEDLARLATVWAAAGAPDCVVEITVETLLRVTGARIASIV